MFDLLERYYSVLWRLQVWSILSLISLLLVGSNATLIQLAALVFAVASVPSEVIKCSRKVMK